MTDPTKTVARPFAQIVTKKNGRLHCPKCDRPVQVMPHRCPVNRAR